MEREGNAEDRDQGYVDDALLFESSLECVDDVADALYLMSLYEHARMKARSGFLDSLGRGKPQKPLKA